MFDNIKMKYFKNYVINEVKAITGLSSDKVKILVEDFFNIIEKGVGIYATENNISTDEARKDVINKIEQRINESKNKS